MSQTDYSGRPKPRLEVTVIFGIAATRAYADGEQNLEVLGKYGTIKTFKFDTLEELNAFLRGIDEATGYQDTAVMDD